MSGLRTVEEHLDRILSTVRMLPVESVAVADALGATLRETVTAAVDIPPFDNSAMDGFAVRFADVSGVGAAAPALLRITADLPAGAGADPTLGAGEGARIMTGAPLPSDADTVVPFEDTEAGLTDSLIETRVVRSPRAEGAHVRRRGEDLRIGDSVLAPGVRIGPLQAGAAAASGVQTLVVSTRPKVAVISTGNELVAPGAPLRRGQIPESNSVLLAGMVIAADAEVIARESVDDEGTALQLALARAVDAGAGVVVFSGGVSAGAFEVVRNELAEYMEFIQVAMQPGKPQGFGVTSGGALLFGLPGNPVSAAVSFEVFVRPALLAAQGRTSFHRPRLPLPAAVAWRPPRGRRQYLPAVVENAPDGAWRVRPATAGGSASHLAGGLGRAQALAIVPADVDAVEIGDPVDVMLLEGWGV
jgi:molybdopterin molybdotransferase